MGSPTFASCCRAALVLGFGAMPVAAQFPAFFEDDVLVASTTVAGEQLGISVALDGNTAMVGADKNSDGSLGGYVFEFGPEGWNDVLTVTVPFADPCLFGDAVAIDGSRAVMADPYSGSGGFCDGFGTLGRLQNISGTWGQTGFQGGATGTLIYGVSLAMSGDHLLAGASGYNGSPGIFEDPAVVFHRFDAGAWPVQRVFSGSDTVTFDAFGISVAMSADGMSAVVGAYRADLPGAFDAGAAYVFRYDGEQWIEEQKLVAADPSNDDGFGRSVAIEGNWIAVGSFWDDTPTTNAGSVYVYQFDGAQWNQTQNFGPPGQQLNGGFGYALSMTDDLLAVGSFMNAAFLYRRQASGFLPLQKLEKSPSIAGVGFGSAIALSGQRCLVGDSSAKVAGTTSGAAFSFEVAELALTADASSVLGGGKLRLTVQGGVPNTQVALIYRLRNGTSGLGSPSFGNKTVGVFNAEGRYKTTITVPNALSGAAIQFTANGLFQPDTLGASNVLSVRVL